MSDELSLKKLWWIASYPKSGNTWARCFMNAYVSGMPIDLNASYSQYTQNDITETSFQATSMVPIHKFPSTFYPYFRPAVLMNVIAGKGGGDVCLKTHHAKLECDGIPLIPPKMSRGSVYIVRDPRDVAVSFADHMGESIDDAIEMMANPNTYISRDGAKHIYHVLTSWSGHVDSWTEHNEDVNCTVIKFEDMLDDPRAEFEKILKALGFPTVDEARMNFALKETSFDSLQSKEEHTPFQEAGKGGKFFRFGQAGRWKEVLTDEQVETIERNHENTMERLGYEPALVTA